MPPDRPRLLIADDDPVVTSVLAAQLSESFDIVAGAADADEAISAAAEHTPDVAVIDVQMPGGGGLRATQEIRTRSPGTAIVALSADESEETVLAMIEAGAVAYVRKGASGDELAATLRRSIEAHAKLASGSDAS